MQPGKPMNVPVERNPSSGGVKVAMNRKRVRFTTLLIGLVFVMAIGVVSVSGDTGGLPDVDVSPPQNEVRGDELVVGDIVAEGVRTKDGTCDFDVIKVKTTAPDDGKTRWLGILLDTECRAVVNAKWEGSLETGPQDVVEPLLGVLPAASEPVPESPQPGLANNDDISTPGVRATKTSEQHVFMYGYGGKWDKLTHKYGRLTFSYNGQSATIISQYGSCQGSSPFPWYSWDVDGCYTISVYYGPGSVVWRTGRGDYHCDPAGTFPCNLSNPDGYYHRLYDDEDGYANGTSHCTYWWSGNIASGVSTEILQGCQ